MACLTPQSKAKCPAPPAVFYGPLEPGNPVVDSLESDLRDCLSFLRPRRGGADAGAAWEQEPHRRGATTLFNIWNTYKPRFPDWYYNEKLVKIGDQLMEMKEYKLALLQCYGRYLQQICKVDLDKLGLDVHQFQAHFFPNGFRDKSAARTFHVLQARNICIYRMVCGNDMDLLNQESLRTCFKILSILQLIMQMTLPHENLCWLVYNGTIHMYTICRHLMTVGQSAKVHEYLLWACICMESSIPLVAVRYLPWRATLYAAVCQCYYDCQAGMHGEVFARRGLIKIDELKQIENMSSSPLSPETKKKFKEATVKMATMIFKRSVFEPRRRPKGAFRPRVKTNLKDAQHLPWPRTISERLLMEMFDCSSSQFFAILEALFDKNRRTLIPSPPIPDELEIRDVISELFFAGMDILDGGGSSTQGSMPSDVSGMILASSTLMQQIVAGKNGISGDAALRFLKMAFSYEEWDTFDHVAGLFFTFLKSQKCPAWKKAETELKILLAMQPLVYSRKPKHGLCIQNNTIRETSAARAPGKKSIAFQERSVQVGKTTDELFLLAITLYYSICTSKEVLLPDREMVVDAIMFLWQKCKVGIQRIQMSGSNFLKLPKKYQTPKWVHILYIVTEVIYSINLGDVNTVVMAEAVLRLTAVLENIAEFTRRSVPKPEKNDSVSASEFCIDGMTSLIQRCPSEQLFFAYQYLDRGISAMNRARLLTVLPDGTSVLDNCCKKIVVNDQHLNRPPANGVNEKSIAGNNFLMDLHLELIKAQHRVAVKLLELTRDTQIGDKNTKFQSPIQNIKKPKYLTALKNCFTEQDVMMKIKKNKLSKALYLMQTATLKFPVGVANASPNQLLEEAFTLIQKAEAQQKVLCATFQQPESNAKSKVPPPPILLSRSHCSMTFKPAPFASHEKVSWYCIFGCIAEGSNRKVRLNNYNLKNSAEMVPANENCILEVKGLETNESYIFAVAAYSSDGKLIGDSIGETTKPILAYPPLSVATVRAYLIQSAFQMENYTLCKRAFKPLWNYFVSVPHTPVADVTVVSASSSVTMPKYRLIPEAVSQASPNLLYLFIRSIFIIGDISVLDGALICDSVCFNELKYNRQIARLTECGRMLVAVELSNWLNDVQYSLQAVVHCYGLIAPLIYHRIPSEPVIQITIKCLTVLYEIPSTIIQRKPTACYESIQHMIACSCFFTAKVLRSWKEYELALVIINYGKKLLDSSQTTSPITAGEDGGDEILESEMLYKRLKSLAATEKVNENLEALESNLLKLTRPGQELIGEEDTLCLFPVVSAWQTRAAYKEVLKFKKSPRFLEYFVKLVYKALNEERFQRLVDWSDEIQDYIKKRNRFLLGIKRKPRRRKIAQKKNLGLPKTVGKKKPTSKKKGQYKSKSLDPQRKEREEARKLAFQLLIQKLNLRGSVFLKRRRFRQITVEEMPWRSQLNIYLAIANFNLFRKQIEELCNIDINCLQSLNSYDELDPELFSLNKSGTIVVTATKEVKVKVCNVPLFKTTPSGRIKRKTDTLDPASPEFDSGPSLPASDPTLQSTSSDTDSNSSLLDHSNCLTPETDVMRDPSDLTQGSSSVPDSDDTFQHSTKLNERDSPRIHGANDRGYITLKERERALCYAAAQEHFTKTFLHFRRAVVVAHRGGHWTLLQNACRDLWNYTQESRMIINQLESFYSPFPITKELFLNSIWLPYYMASDTLLDMIIDLQATNSVKIIEDEGDFCVPSCIGSTADENGGCNLYFEYPFDDVTVVDLRGVCNLILQTLEILFHLKKWESLVCIAMQFNTVTHERYTEQVTPLLVFAQRQIQERIQSRDSNTSQPLFTELVTNTGKKVSCRDFVTKKLHSATKYNPGTDELHFTSSDVNKLQLQVSVPVDVRDTLKCFRESIEKSKHHNAAIRYSRKLLSLFLANTQDHSEVCSRPFQIAPRGRVGFIMGAELTYQPEPPELSEENFAYLSTVQSNSIPQSKLSTVIISYEKTLESLQTFNQHSLKVQASHELGNLHFYAGNKRAAFKYWCQGLDGALHITDALHHWQELDGLSDSSSGNLANNSQGYCEKFISQAGIWGCLQGAVLAAKIAQYLLLYDLKFRTKTCILSAILFKSLFRASLPHPTADCDFAQYETGILIPGIDIFLDYNRADIATVVASLNFVIYELHCSKQNLIILPLFTLYQYFVSEICRDAVKSIEGRILKIKVLTDLGFFSDAFNEICIINHGEKIPWKLPSVYRLTSKLPVFAKFDTSQPIMTNCNLQVLEDVFNRSLHSFWSSLCEPRIMNNFMLAKMHFIICVAATLNCIPEKVPKTMYCTDSDTLRKGGKTADAVMKGFVLTAVFVAGKREPNVMIVELEKFKETLNIAMLKGILLAEAEERITFILESMQIKYGTLINECSAAELETVIEAKLQLAAIAQQRLQTTLSAALVYSAIKLLQDANVFKTPDFLQAKQRTDEASEDYIYIEDSKLLYNVVARERMNIHVWLKCRLALVSAVTAQARGIGTMKENELAECSCLINEVQKEAEAFNAVETLAEITMQAVMLQLQERQPVADIKLHLQTIIKLLEEKTLISPPACLTLVQSMLLLADIMRTQAENGSAHHTSKVDQLNLLILAHRLVIEQLFILGQSIEQHAENPTFTMPRVPFKNVYLPHLKLLAKVKMRIGHALTLELSCTPETQNELQWLQALKHTETALELCTASVRKELDLEAELLFRKGKIERQINMIHGDKSIIAVESFLNAIKLSLQSYQNYGLIRRSYLEIALLYFYLITNKDESLSSSPLMERTCKLKDDSRDRPSSEEITPHDINRVQIWIAVRAAAQVSEAFLASQQLIGKKAVKLYDIRERIQQEIPEFARLDLSSSYKDFLSDGYEVSYKAPTVPSVPDDRSETDGSQSMSSEESQGKPKISWVHIIRYHTYLTRLLNMSPLLAVPKEGAGLFAKEDALFTSVFDTSTTLRLAAVHSFLKTYLPVYPGGSLQEPPRELYDFQKPCISASILQKPTLETLAGSIQMSTESLASSLECSSEMNIQIENKATSTPIRELCVQWYLPSLEQMLEGELTMVLFVYAYNTKPVQITNVKYFNSANINCGYLWIPLKSVIAVCEKLSDLRQHIEILMQSPVTADSQTQKDFLLTRSQIQIGKVKLDEKTKKMVKQCFSEIKVLLSIGRKQLLPLTEIPFDITLPSIKNLQKLFDPATGCVITAGNVFNWMVSLLE
ncbi:cilia- and flagella-associated protein 54 [Tiliqua scincoides]|uniref:cilia- and flagella-associated protein 54 n=1 Tax=Tiliqua scincoides TaxID=71010 RepID=UPI0034637A1B